MIHENVLNLAAFLKNTRMVGPGTRDAIWVQGCSIRCRGCANKAYIPHVKRVLMPAERLKAHFYTRKGKIDGCSVLGGEPTEQAGAVTRLLRSVKSLGMSTVLFTGRLLEDLHNEKKFDEMLSYTDLLIDGPFIEDLQDTSLHWRGSANQRLVLLSDRFTQEDLKAESLNSELILSQEGMLLHGVGTYPLFPLFPR